MEGQTIAAQTYKLPIQQKKQEIMQTIQKEQIVIISGKTGCGKSTQVPQYILQSDSKAKIVVVVPRFLAAESLAKRVKEQIKAKPELFKNMTVGYHSREREDDENNILFSTYSAFKHHILAKQEIPYSHIILDEIHQRTLQMDMSFIILKKLINSTNTKKSPKIVIMSATINSEKFSEYFSISQRSLKVYWKSLNQIQEEYIQSLRQSKTSYEKVQIKKDQDAQKKKEWNQKINKLKPATLISIQQKPLHQISQRFIADILDQKQNQKLYNYDLEKMNLEIKHQHYLKAKKIIDYYNQYEGFLGDILVFLPGLAQINQLKSILEKKYANISENNKNEKNKSENVNMENNDLIEQDSEEEQQTKKQEKISSRIVILHSQYRDQMYEKIMDKSIKNKIFLSTDIAESSITLENCQVVIDFCLLRKAFNKENQGIIKLHTFLASKSNLIQRRGRVGRTKPGHVYRLISQRLYEKLDDYQSPQITRVNLKKQIIQLKSQENKLFQDPYQIMMNSIEPPSFQCITKGISQLIQIDALSEKNQKSKRKQYNKQNFDFYEGKHLKLTKFGRYLAKMPCNLELSIFILMGINLGITNRIVDMAAIISAQKTFFIKADFRLNIQYFIQNMIKIDDKCYNDYLLRQEMFYGWKKKFFLPFLNKKQIPSSSKNKKYISKQEKKKLQNMNFTNQNSQISMKLIEKFKNIKKSKQQIKYCQKYGLNPRSMRQILQISENVKKKLVQMKYNLKEISCDEISNISVKICLFKAFQQNICRVSGQNLIQNSQQVHKNQRISNRYPIICSKQQFQLIPWKSKQGAFDIQNLKYFFGSSFKKQKGKIILSQNQVHKIHLTSILKQKFKIQDIQTYNYSLFLESMMTQSSLRPCQQQIHKISQEDQVQYSHYHKNIDKQKYFVSNKSDSINMCISLPLKQYKLITNQFIKIKKTNLCAMSCMLRNAEVQALQLIFANKIYVKLQWPYNYVSHVAVGKTLHFQKRKILQSQDSLIFAMSGQTFLKLVQIRKLFKQLNNPNDQSTYFSSIGKEDILFIQKWIQEFINKKGNFTKQQREMKQQYSLYQKIQKQKQKIKKQKNSTTKYETISQSLQSYNQQQKQSQTYFLNQEKAYNVLVKNNFSIETAYKKWKHSFLKKHFQDIQKIVQDIQTINQNEVIQNLLKKYYQLYSLYSNIDSGLISRKGKVLSSINLMQQYLKIDFLDFYCSCCHQYPFEKLQFQDYSLQNKDILQRYYNNHKEIWRSFSYNYQYKPENLQILRRFYPKYQLCRAFVNHFKSKQHQLAVQKMQIRQKDSLQNSKQFIRDKQFKIIQKLSKFQGAQYALVCSKQKEIKTKLLQETQSKLKKQKQKFAEWKKLLLKQHFQNLSNFVQEISNVNEKSIIQNFNKQIQNSYRKIISSKLEQIISPKFQCKCCNLYPFKYLYLHDYSKNNQKVLRHYQSQFDKIRMQFSYFYSRTDKPPIQNSSRFYPKYNLSIELLKHFESNQHLKSAEKFQDVQKDTIQILEQSIKDKQSKIVQKLKIYIKDQASLIESKQKQIQIKLLQVIQIKLEEQRKKFKIQKQKERITMQSLLEQQRRFNYLNRRYY